MPGILEDPQVVRDALAAFHDLVANDCQRRHFAEDLPGRFGADRTTVGGIHREFAPTTDPSGLNTWGRALRRNGPSRSGRPSAKPAERCSGNPSGRR